MPKCVSRRKFLKKDSVAAKILLEINDELDLLFSFGYRPTKVMKYGMDGVRRMREPKMRAERRRSLKRLHTKNLISILKKDEEYQVALTRAGALEVFRLKVLYSAPLPKGSVCMVIFDIPETERTLRKNMRNFLQVAGFICWQRSVWISFFDAGEHLERLFEVNGVSDWMKVYLATRYCKIK